MNQMEQLIEDATFTVCKLFGGKFTDEKKMAFEQFIKRTLIQIYEETMKINTMKNLKTNGEVVINIEKVEIHLK